MAKLTVKNVGPIKEAELDVKKYTVFIGPQGSGKSTLAKLIAIGGDEDNIPYQDIYRMSKIRLENYDKEKSMLREKLMAKYNLSHINPEHLQVFFTDMFYEINFNHPSPLKLTKNGSNLLNNFTLNGMNYNNMPDFELYRNNKDWVLWYSDLVTGKFRREDFEPFADTPYKTYYDTFFDNKVLIYKSLYIPAERTLISILSDAFWNLSATGFSWTQSISSFGKEIEFARQNIGKFYIPYLNIYFGYEDGVSLVYFNADETISLTQSASGYQSIIPLLLVVENHRRNYESKRRFIIEEPELNLYPVAQKDLIYNLVSGLDPNVAYQDSEWVFTTHSPYVLTSLNTLMLAHKVAQRSDELQAEVEKIIPSRHWINPDDFAAYYVDNGTVRSIMNEKTGLIDDNELDDASDAFADEQEALFALNRTARKSRA